MRYGALFLQHHESAGQQIRAAARGRGWAHKLSGPLRRRQGSGMGGLVLERNQEVNVRDPSGSSRAQTLWKMRGRHRKRRRVLRPDQRAEHRQSGRGSAGIAAEGLGEPSAGVDLKKGRQQALRQLEGAEMNLAWFLSLFFFDL